MCDPAAQEMWVIGSLCGVPYGLVVFCGPVLDDIPAMACGLSASLSSVGLLRLGDCTMEKGLMALLLVMNTDVFSRLNRSAAHKLSVLAGGIR